MLNLFSLFDDELPRDLLMGEEEEEEEQEGADGGGEGGDGGDGNDGGEGDGEGADGGEGDEGKDGDDKDGKDDQINVDDFSPEARDGDDDGGEGDDKDLEGIDEDDKKTINKVVDSKMKKINETIQRQKDELELSTYIGEHPEMKKYRPVIEKYMAHPAYRKIPVANIAAIVSSKDAMKLGAQKEREAAKRAAETRDPGNNARKPGAGKQDWHKASKDDFEAKRREVMGMR